MNKARGLKAHWSFWLVALFALVWMAGGCANFVTQMLMGAAIYPQLSEGQLALVQDRPVWATAGFGVAMVIGVLACFLLLYKRKHCAALFWISLFGVFVVLAHGAMVYSSGATFTTTEIVMYFVGQVLLSAFLVWYSYYAIKKGWLR